MKAISELVKFPLIAVGSWLLETYARQVRPVPTLTLAGVAFRRAAELLPSPVMCAVRHFRLGNPSQESHLWLPRTRFERDFRGSWR